ncbi:MAG TPA: spermidine/putrescine ABC transporter ATP-binding protein PotA [Moraxella sp.]|uniref:Spermidine/putrescine import ATP-binding protein PotA n=2 Tax=Moraxella tetraodonis TaxID=2767221 RepID=A0A9X1US38_9GAMM|nr:MULTISPECIES: spermidine/putrescine ABC transporter ATP-binding protein PotA [Moraxella]MCG8148028.1 spermidine/putrescine ABC transporter ATP-binding protein PotA [Moraxella tetraodonis]HCN14727.1 spermidine/putrescine ABC transporter ATP-binding protein PotA [Moraxellaceae bacterium]MBD3726904.1 spermidine/putrescine ABC transporter ATP-binding protein PotA [Moraxella osloensis]MCK6052055.1 spermidine/putrescine ABC transporter ATP-binding protein PotA [Moraxella osloensis]HCC66876.1 sper
MPDSAQPTNQKPVLLQIRHLSKSYGDTQILQNINLDIYDGEFLTLLGPSGCGKTTLLRLIGGFELPNAGSLQLEGVDIAGLPAEKRPINTVFQQYALFPHMNVYDNIAYGLKLKGVPKTEIDQRVREALAMVQLDHTINRRPQDLSGGQQQRIAIARAVVNRPKMLLLDEPLSALDAKLREQMQSELKRLQRELGITFVFVTHDQQEALSMSDRIAVMKNGVFQQIDTPIGIYESPANLFTASFIGETNLFKGKVLEVNPATIKVEVVEQNDGFHPIRELPRPKFDVQVGQNVNLLLRPEDIRVYYTHEGHEGLIGNVVDSAYKGSTLDSVIRLKNGNIVKTSEYFNEDDPNFNYKLGQEVRIDWVDGWEWILPDE